MAIGDGPAAPDFIVDTTPGCGSPLTNALKLWAWEAVMIKNGQGELQPVKLFFDTGSDDNLASKNFAKEKKLELRLILPEDMREYRTPNGPLFPTEYIEIWLKDDKHGMQDFAKVRCTIIEDLGGIGLIAGSGFMEEHGIILDPTKSRDMFPVVAGKASGKAKAEQKLLFEKVARDSERAAGFGATATRSTATSSRTTSGVKNADSSCTSTSSSSKANPQKD